jgi:hypothetical protein
VNTLINDRARRNARPPLLALLHRGTFLLTAIHPYVRLTTIGAPPSASRHEPRRCMIRILSINPQSAPVSQP